MDSELHETRGYLQEAFRLFHLRDTQMQAVSWHDHSFHKLIFFLGGQAGYDIEGQHYLLEPGDIILVGRGDIHRPEVEPGLTYERVIVYLSPDFLRGLSTPDCDLETCFHMARAQFRFVLRPTAHAAHLADLLRRLERALAADGFGSAMLAQSILISLLVELTRGMLDHGLPYSQTAQYDKKTTEILKYLGEHLTEPISIDDLSAQFYISKYYMMRKFREETGHTIHNYLIGKRLVLARDLIAAGTPISDACFRCGFQDYSTFSRAYKRLFGHTPRYGSAEMTFVTE